MPNSTYNKQQADALAFIKASQDNWNWNDQEIANYVSQFPNNPQTKVVLSFLTYDKQYTHEEIYKKTTNDC